MTPLTDTSPEQLAARVHRFLALPQSYPGLSSRPSQQPQAPKSPATLARSTTQPPSTMKNSAYLIWGISDDHHVVGTTFSWQTTKGKGNEDLLPWLTRAIIPTPQLKFLDV